MIQPERLGKDNIDDIVLEREHVLDIKGWVCGVRMSCKAGTSW